MTRPVLVFVTDPSYPVATSAAVARAAGRAVGPGALVVQLRDKDATDASLRATAQVLRVATSDVGARLVINGSLEVAAEVAADGVHFANLGPATADRAAAVRERLGAGAFVSTTAHDDDEMRHAAVSRVDAVLVSPLFETPGKGRPRGVAALCAARALLVAVRQDSVPLLFGLGGVTGANAAACAAAGADGVAAIRALYEGAAPHLAEPFLRARCP